MGFNYRKSLRLCAGRMFESFMVLRYFSFTPVKKQDLFRNTVPGISKDGDPSPEEPASKLNLLFIHFKF